MISKTTLALGAIFGVALLLHSPTAGAAEQPAASAKDPYSYTAKAGDSYTVLARKAVQTFGIREKVNLSLAQIVAAETVLADAAGMPEINEGQTVKFESAKVKKAMEDAKKISDDALAAWQVYVPYVDFDTRQNG